MKSKLYFFMLVCILLILPCTAYAEQEAPFAGFGTMEDPYLICSFDDLCSLSSLVNSGNEFEGKYFLQTQNIDMMDIPFTPIGLFDGISHFSGVYNGNGYYLKNIRISYGGNNGLFGQLGGTVMNLGIESGQISGACIGAISSHSSKSSALIINCYNKATVSGYRVGGIADNFNGSIINCWSDCDLVASDVHSVGAIYSYSSLIARNNYSAICQDGNACRQDNCTFLPYSIENAQKIVDALNSRLYDSAVASGIKPSALKEWSLDISGNITLSQKPYTFTLREIPIVIEANLIYIFPIIFAVIGLVLICLCFLHAQGRCKNVILNNLKHNS